ncbi:Head-to-tail connector protein, podovirus-type [uncultured Caudovirales phage]|uniref:Head-to-tail connector protein, podovirus-type n=1 Tax=uncultured Caudovirales phage TaxID=2100421 RepID=A0A6J7WZM1_9CAUD|nr:Head-to-tail connector protein, podovirus-type [uncultured Caudovirales phage]
MEYDKSAPGGTRLTPEQIIKRQAAAQTKKDEFQQLYQDAYEFALPQRQLYGVWEGGAVGSKKMQRVFDSTAINSTQRFANRLQSVVFPPQRKWATLEPGSDIPFEKQQMARNIFETYCDKMFTVLQQSNFDIAMGEFLLDLSVGTACMMVQPGDSVNPINFIPVPLFLVSYEEGANGQVDNVYRKIRMKGESIIRQWPDAKIPPEMQRRIDQKPTDDIEMLEATIYDHGRGDYCYHVIDKVSKAELVYRRRKSSPWVISRYMKVAGEIYGRGPLMTALPDIKTLNKTIELLLKNASMAVSGVYTAADDGVLNPNTVKLVPGAIIPVARNGGPQGPALQALPRSGDFNVSQLVINDLRSNIKRILLDESLPPENMSARSATEIVERMKELAQNLGSAFGRLINETMIPLTAKILEVMDERGLIDMPLRVNGLEVKVVPVAPLAQAQNQEEIGAILNYAQLMQNLGPDGQIALKMDALVDYLGDKMGVPMSVRNNRAERAIMMEEANNQQQMAAMAQMQMMQQQQPQGQPPQQALPAPEGM